MPARRIPDETIQQVIFMLADPRRLTQIDIALACNVSQGFVSLIAQGKLRRVKIAPDGSLLANALVEKDARLGDTAMDHLADRLFKMGVTIRPLDGKDKDKWEAYKAANEADMEKWRPFIEGDRKMSTEEMEAERLRFEAEEEKRNGEK